MVSLEVLLDRLNGTIRSWNADLAEEVKRGKLATREAVLLHVPLPAQAATKQMVLLEPVSRPLEFKRAVDEDLIRVDPNEVYKLCELVQRPTQTVQDLMCGVYNSKRVRPVLVKTIDLAHLVASLQ